MEFGALSYLTGNPEYELKAHRAMEALWSKRHLNYHLVGTVINVHNGEWTNRGRQHVSETWVSPHSLIGTGVGAGIDSYYEYCLKSYILLGNREYLKRFATHYSAVKRYISNGPFLLDVYMNTPVKTSRNFMDSLLAFWPGLQVLWGDVSSAISVHNMLYEVMQKYNFIPEVS
jgi:mannosidase alpha-like ER degradation enhancer 3